MTLATQVGAKSLTTAAKVFVSDAQVEFEQQKYAGQLSGASFSADYEFSPDLFFRYQGLNGKGNFNGSPSDYNFSQNLLYAYRNFDIRNTDLSSWQMSYKIGAGLFNKKSKFANNSYEQSQLPLILGLEITNTNDVQISFSGFGQIDNLQINRSGSISFKVPIGRSLRLIGKYTNHTSKVKKLQHCGSDYFLGLSINF